MRYNDKTINFGAHIDRTIRIIKLNYLKAFKAAGTDLTTEQWVIIDSLASENGVSQNELANDSFKNAPTVSRIIDLLCKKGLTERHRFDNDRRRYKIYLTPTGKQLHEKILPIVQNLRKQGWNDLTLQDYENLLRILDQICENFGEQVEK